MCDKIGYLFVNFRFLLSWRNLSGNFKVFEIFINNPGADFSRSGSVFEKVITTIVHARTECEDRARILETEFAILDNAIFYIRHSNH